MLALVPLRGCPERSLYAAVKINPTLFDKHWDIVDVDDMGHQLSKAA